MICHNIHTALSPLLQQYDSNQIVVVKDAAVRFDTGYPTLSLSVSEDTKSLETVQQIWDFLFARHITRKGLLIAVGGGALTDMAGFAAATYKRGIDTINIPTTLLAMVDASTGGKTGINYHGLKNSIGTFSIPKETLICAEWLRTLPAQQFLSGFGEMLKTGLIAMETGKWKMDNLWDKLLQYDLDTMPIEAITPLIEQCIAVKERIVAADPKEEGLRKVLNLGHTFGHALEEVSIQQSAVSNQMLHGYAVVYGMIAELYLSVTKLGYPKAHLQQLTQLMLHYYGKPQCKCSDFDRLIALMQQDKKNEHADTINCTLMHDIGSPAINQEISTDEAREALDYLFSL